MELEDQVCTLKQAKKLKALGVHQYQGPLMWFEVSNGGVEWHPCLTIQLPGYLRSIPITTLDSGLTTSNGEFCSHKEPVAGFTVAELGVMLPHNYATVRFNDGDWYCGDNDDFIDSMMPGKTAAESMANQLITLLEGQFDVTTEQVNQRLAAA